MSKELIDLWKEFKTTEEYKQASISANLASAGMGFLGSHREIFEVFMEWIEKK